MRRPLYLPNDLFEEELVRLVRKRMTSIEVLISKLAYKILSNYI